VQSFDLIRVVFILIPMILALTVHEFAHAFVANKLGDQTAKYLGRMTLNPLSHIDPIGTLLIPAIGMLANAPFFGWAKPVPFNPLQFNRGIRMKTGILLTAIAGPISNLLFAFVLAIILGQIGPAALRDILLGSKGLQVALVRLAGWTLLINVGLFVFNLIPIPPLDGNKVLAGFLPDRFYPALDAFNRYSFVLFILLLVVGGRFLSFPVMWIIHGFSEVVGFNLWYSLYGVL
jgi:Zn-dependent protease